MYVDDMDEAEVLEWLQYSGPTITDNDRGDLERRLVELRAD